MGEISDKSVHLVVTSPPYWQLKDYGGGDQIGFNDTYEAYINNLNLVWSECQRVLSEGCRLCVNIGDQFARSVYYGRYKVMPIRTEIIKFCESSGFDYMGAIIWQKVTTCNTSGGAVIMGSYPYPRNGIIKLDYEFILVFKKYGTGPNVEAETKEASKMTPEEWNQYFTGHWNFPGDKQNKHLAMFPEELPRRLIKMFSFTGDTVLDPFLGSGTTILAAKNLDRNSIGYEINDEFLPIIEEKVGLKQPGIFQNANFKIIRPEKFQNDFAGNIQKLPYIFVDPIKFDKKVDPKKLNFGSKVDHNSSANHQYFTVSEIISPTVLLLNDGTSHIKVKLTGLAEDPETREKAIEFLTEKVKGKKVYLKHELESGGTNASDRGYVYLKNKTFVNAHLIKKGLAEVDVSIDFKYMEKFLRLRREN
ncbi:MAG: thermonuclease family protein [Deltaproteobacteria bacterium]|nr:thermonuclease family protein [Deltaproteobacteria bacterium]